MYRPMIVYSRNASPDLPKIGKSGFTQPGRSGNVFLLPDNSRPPVESLGNDEAVAQPTKLPRIQMDDVDHRIPAPMPFRAVNRQPL
jgi:hypothetical protein